MEKKPIGERMKEQYEQRFRYMLPRRSYTIIRLDGVCFHRLTKAFERPYDSKFAGAMNQVGIELCDFVQGAKFAYVQSDEVSVLVTDFDTVATEMWFNGNVQKMASVSASKASVAFNAEMALDALFDSRVFQIADISDVVNYFIWRQQDATRNSIQMAAQSMFSQKELHGKKCSDLQEMMFQQGVNWNDYDEGFKRGRVIHNGSVVNPPVFTKDRNFILDMIPKLGE